MEKDSKIYIADHTGLVGGAITRCLKWSGFTNLLTRDLEELDLTDQKKTNGFFEKEKPEYFFLAVVKVGSIGANSTYPS